MTVVRRADRRETATPNATMTTLASPTLGGADCALWTVRMGPGAVGPEHAFDCPVVWAVTAGGATVRRHDGVHDLAAGDTIVLAADQLRQVSAGPEGMDAVVTCHGAGRVVRGDGSPAGVPPWVA